MHTVQFQFTIVLIGPKSTGRINLVAILRCDSVLPPPPVSVKTENQIKNKYISAFSFVRLRHCHESRRVGRARDASLPYVSSPRPAVNLTVAVVPVCRSRQPVRPVRLCRKCRSWNLTTGPVFAGTVSCSRSRAVVFSNSLSARDEPEWPF